MIVLKLRFAIIEIFIAKDHPFEDLTHGSFVVRLREL